VSRRSLIFVDANTIWHRRLAEALGEVVETVALLPEADLRLRLEVEVPPGMGAQFVKLGLPPGWASTGSQLGQFILAKRIAKLARSLHEPVVILTSPAYGPLSKILASQFPIIYYCADDYQSYLGWTKPASQEKAIIGRSVLSVFVSEALRIRAVEEYGASATSTFVSPNATEPRFAMGRGGHTEMRTAWEPPILGILGGVSDRLDLEFIRRVAELPAVGTLLIAGPVPTAVQAELRWLTEAKVVITGRIPHSDMHLLANSMDAALIPYSKSKLNWYCSPMRLYDHLATGVPIYALDTCDQIRRMRHPSVTVAGEGELMTRLSQGIAPRGSVIVDQSLFWRARAEALVERIELAVSGHSG
jgi:hypothetical protein